VTFVCALAYRGSQDLIAAVAPFTVPTGSRTAIVTTADDPNSAALIDKMLAEPFESFTFTRAGVALPKP
jgi:hypothetical protein